MQIIHSIDKMGLWHRLPVILGLFYLGLRRHLHQQYNLLNVGATPVGLRFNPVDYPYRTADGEFNDPFQDEAGGEGTFFGRNMPPQDQKGSVSYISSNFRYATAKNIRRTEAAVLIVLKMVFSSQSLQLNQVSLEIIFKLPSRIAFKNIFEW